MPAAVPYIGYLSDDTGPYDGTVAIIVEMFAQADVGVSLWGPVEFAGVVVESGVFTVVLGAPSGPELDTLVLPAGGAWLEFTIDGTLLEPRQEMLSVPYALWAESADACVEAESLGDSGCSDGQVIKWVAGSGVWTCANDLGGGGAEYTAGTGLNLAGTEFSVVAATIEAWATGVCYHTPQELSGALPGWDQDGSDDLMLGDLADVASSGSYDDLADQPDLSVYLKADGSVDLAGDLDIANHRLLNIAVDASGQAPSGPVAGQLWWDGGGDVLRVWTGMEWLGLGSGAGSLPSDGLFTVSNGTLTNELFADYSSSGVPAGIGVSVDVEVAVADSGSLSDLDLSFSLSHPYCPELSVKLLPPGDDEGIVVAAAGEIPGTEFSGAFGIADALPSGVTLQSLLGTEQSGVWLLRVTDTVQNGNEGQGEVTSFELSTSYLASGQVQVNADQSVSGTVSADIMVADSMVADGVDVGAKLAALEGKIWCIESCDPAKIDDCQDRDCDGILQTCTESGPLPDGAACQGGAGVCLAGECCVRLSCVLLGAMCGEASDGCGGFLNCGLCQNQDAVCFENHCCVPATCESLVKECGDWDDGCGGLTGECGPCTNGHLCEDDGQCDGPCALLDGHWQQAKDFCAWVTPGGRLPSESEWEYAATGPVHLKYPWGNSPEPTCSNNTAVFNEAGGTGGYGCGNGGTLPVGTTIADASWCGALDMSGNLWEWCEDWYHGDYNGAPDDGSAWVVPTGSTRVIRGGSFNTGAVTVRSAERSFNTPGYRNASLGARCLMPLP